MPFAQIALGLGLILFGAVLDPLICWLRRLLDV